MMNGAKKSDSSIVPAKLANKAERSAAESVEGGWDQEECGTAKHGPDTESGSRDTSAGPHTRSCNQEQEGEADSALASRQHRRFAVGLL